MLSAVLPLKITGDREQRTLAHVRNLLRTLDHFWTGRTPLDLTVVAPAGEVALIRGELQSTPRLRLTVISEERLLPSHAAYPALPGWFRQMLVKLGFAQYARHPFYLSFDADVICARPFDETTFFRHGRIVTEWEDSAIHPDWWRHSAALLGLPEQPPAPVVAVTPNLFSRSIMLQVLKLLGREPGIAWDQRLAAASDLVTFQWSEQSIYTLAGRHAGLFDLYHWPERAEDWPRFHAPIHLWTREQYDFDLFNPVWWIDNHPNGHFVVVQSTIGYDPAAIMARFEPLLQRPATGAA